MNYNPKQKQNHPRKGSSIKVEPIRSKRAIDRIKKILNPRDRCLFILGINTGYRASELLSITWHQVRNAVAGDILELKQSKNRKHGRVILNKAAIEAIQYYLNNDERFKYRRPHEDDCYLFCTRQSDVLKVPVLINMVKDWCRSAGLQGNYGSHTLRKTWGYWQYKNDTPLPVLMEAYGHSSQQQTLAYMCIESKEVEAVYAMEL